MANSGAGRFMSTMAELEAFGRENQIAFMQREDGAVLVELRQRRIVVPALQIPPGIRTGGGNGHGT